MRILNDLVLNAVNAATTTQSTAIDASNLVSLSMQVVSAGTNLAGTVKLQASNDVLTTPTNWTDIASASVTVSTAGTLLLAKTDICYQWVRAVFTATGTGVQTAICTADTAGSLAGKYFLLYSQGGTSYYVWYKVSGSGTDPAIAGATGAEVDITTNNSATQVGAATATVIAALNSTNDFTAVNGSGTVTITNKTAGSYTPATAGTSGFTLATTTPNGTVTARIKSFGF